MGGVTAENNHCVYIESAMSTPNKSVLPDLVELPLVVVNGTFRCLDKLDEGELEDFLRYLSQYTAKKENRSKYHKPIWWIDELIPFTQEFMRGSKLVFTKEKTRRMRHLIKNVYRHYSSKELLQLSSKFSQMHVLSFHFKTCSDGSVVVVNKAYGNVLVRIPASNMKYDYERQKKNKRDVTLIEIITLDKENPMKHRPMESSDREESAVIIRPIAGVPPIQIIQHDDVVDLTAEHFDVEQDPLNSSIVESAGDENLVDLTIDNYTMEKDPLDITNMYPDNECIQNDRTHPSINGMEQERINAIIVLTDSEDDDTMKVTQQKTNLSTTPKKSLLKSMSPNIKSPATPKKRIRLYDRLNSLKKNGVSFSQCICISDEERYSDDDDVQIISVTKPFDRNLSRESFLRQKRRPRHKNFVHKKKLDARVNGADVPSCSFSSTSEPSGPPDPSYSKDQFLYTLGLLDKNCNNHVTNCPKLIQPKMRLRRYKQPMYYMPLELLPTLVTRGLLSGAELEYNPKEEKEEKKPRKPRKPKIRRKKKYWR